MDDAGVHRGAAQTHQKQAHQRQSARQEHGPDAQSDDRRAHADEGLVVKFHRQEAVDAPADGHAQEEQAGEKRRRRPLHAPAQGQVGAGPKARRLLQAAVAEEGHQDLLRAGDGNDLLQRHRLGRFRLGPAILPQSERQKEDRRQNDLQNAHDPVAPGPVISAGQHPAHDVRTDGRAHAPHAVEPAHVAAGIVEGHIVIQAGVHAACAQAVGDGPEDQHPVFPADAEAEQRAGGHGHGESRDLSGTEPPGQPVAEQARDDGPQRHGHGHRTGIGHRHHKLRIHTGPGRAQQPVRQAQGDEGQVNDGK